MKNVGTSEQVSEQNLASAHAQRGAAADVLAVPAQAGAEGRTKDEVARLLLEEGPMTAAEVADRLSITRTAVRRHLDGLVAADEAQIRDESKHVRRGRGRPAKVFLLTEAGRGRFGHAYDDLAVAALRHLAEYAGQESVRAFAERRVAALVEAHRDTVLSNGSTADRTQALAEALTSEGYAASTREVGAGEQLCQHHCPVAHVAAEFPQLCEAETAAFAELLGTHVQRLATIARGDAACTTHVPVTAAGALKDPVRSPNDGGKSA